MTLEKNPPTAHEIRCIAAKEYYMARAHREAADLLKKEGRSDKAVRNVRRELMKLARQSDIIHKALMIYLDRVAPTSS